MSRPIFPVAVKIHNADPETEQAGDGAFLRKIGRDLKTTLKLAPTPRLQDALKILNDEREK